MPKGMTKLQVGQKFYPEKDVEIEITDIDDDAWIKCRVVRRDDYDTEFVIVHDWFPRERYLDGKPVYRVLVYRIYPEE